VPLRLNVSEEFFSDGLGVLEIAGVQFAEFGRGSFVELGGGGFDFGATLVVGRGVWFGVFSINSRSSLGMKALSDLIWRMVLPTLNETWGPLCSVTSMDITVSPPL